MTGNKIRLSKSSISQKEKNAVLAILDREYLGMGEEVQLFEQKIKEYLQTSKDIVCVNTGTSALHLSLLCLDIGPGDEVLVPSLTYVASFQAISATGATPIPCDVIDETLFLDVKDAEKRITKKTKAIMPVHYASNSKGIDDVYLLAIKHNLRVIEDAAHSFGCIRDGELIGCKGDIICFSFDGIKNITSGEGGAIISGDNTFVQRIKDARLLGVEKDTEKRYSGQRSWNFDVKHQGLRYHMSNLMAAIGISQLARFKHFQKARARAVKYYLDNLNFDEVNLLKLDYENITSHIFVIKANKRNALREYLLENNVECGIHYKPAHLLTKYSLGYKLPITEKNYEEILTLPLHFDLTEAEQEEVVMLIGKFYER